MERRTTIIRLASLLSGSALALGLLLLCGSKAYAHDYSDEEYHRHEHGKLMLALDLDYGTALEHSNVDEGGGGAIRIGFEHDMFLVSLIPELQLDYHRLTADPNDASITTAKVGGRIRFLKILEPGIFAHAGLGHIGGDQVYEHTGIAFDAGLTLDLTILPLIDIGLHTAWNRIFGDSETGVSYVTAGAHLALVL